MWAQHSHDACAEEVQPEKEHQKEQSRNLNSVPPARVTILKKSKSYMYFKNL